MTWKLWIDDDAGKEDIAAWRNPPTNDWMVAHSSCEAIAFVEAHGLPSHIDFDHDLGIMEGTMEIDTSMRFLRWLKWSDFFQGEVPQYKIHSANPEGSKNIISFMESWKKSKTL